MHTKQKNTDNKSDIIANICLKKRLQIDKENFLFHINSRIVIVTLPDVISVIEILGLFSSFGGYQ